MRARDKLTLDMDTAKGTFTARTADAQDGHKVYAAEHEG